APVRVGPDLERVRLARVSGAYFDVLGLAPALGRAISEHDSATDAPVAVVSEAFWARAYARDAAALGSSIKLQDRLFTIVGVAPASFRGIDLGRAVDIWTPLASDERADARRNRGLGVIARLKRGATQPE